ncbi:hypothetical protein AURDEDRAFT_125117 [Auricularia subglabra TFB-10046 SS5]|uniref:C2H2-type domain-containing protein n=1 Tax=Auricularia subglabra (strain TFB-10046 / SS5) TaxID=717982 RepID=J0LKJ8_AURST|nr:hypothetical protein AURDEDRAFT_125117 [Auricularia subglabra TFB-10046 SS5]
MAFPFAPLRCLWHDCPSPGPFATDEALFEHLKATHTPALDDDAPFVCRWFGCGHSSSAAQPRIFHLSLMLPAQATRTTAQRTPARRTYPALAPGTDSACRYEWAGCTAAAFPDAPALRGHIEEAHARGVRTGTRSHLPAWYKPVACSTCDRTFATTAGLARHTAARHPAVMTAAADPDDGSGDSESESQSECRCEWAGCDGRLFADAPKLLAHIKEAHTRGQARCAWAGCGHRFFAGTALSHLWSHLPAWYTPFACPVCGRACRSLGGLARHLAAHPTAEPDGYAPDSTHATLLPDDEPAAKRRRLEPHSPDDSESELDIVFDAPLTPKLETHECSDEIAIAVAEIVDSPVWALAAQLPAAKTTPRSEAQVVSVEDGNDREYCITKERPRVEGVPRGGSYVFSSSPWYPTVGERLRGQLGRRFDTEARRRTRRRR